MIYGQRNTRLLTRTRSFFEQFCISCPAIFIIVQGHHFWHMLKRVFKLFSRRGESNQDADSQTLTREIVPRDQHNISREQISDNALKVLYRLSKAGHEAYLVGGGVRDLLLGQQPKDFDVVTNATPEEVKALFRNCRLVGRRFRLAHILFGREIIEVATMRGHPERHETKEGVAKQDDNGMILRDNVWGTIEEDAERRDFSVNALYYSIADYSLHAFAGGLDAIKARRLELIGDPETRYREDPVRMLRAVRFTTKLGMTMSEATEKPLKELAPLMASIPAARLFEECNKLFLAGHAVENLRLLRYYGLFDVLFPQLASHLSKDPEAADEKFIGLALANTDQRVNEGKSVTPAFLYASLLWPLVEQLAANLRLESGLNSHEAFQVACSEALDNQQQHVAIPRRFSTLIREIWQLQYRLPKRAGKRAERLMEHNRFRAAYDFLLVRAKAEGGKVKELADWWTDYQQANPSKRQTMSHDNGTDKPRRRRRPRRGPRRQHRPRNNKSEQSGDQNAS